MKLRSTLVSFALLFVAASAFAWPTCKGNWVQVPKGTGSTNGVIYITGDNLTFQCQVPPPVTPPVKPTPVSTSSNASSSASSAANSASNSASSSNQHQGQQQGQTANGGNASSTSSATENGNNSNNTSSVTNIAAPKVPVATAYAPSVYPTVTCFKGFGAGIQTAPIGASFGGGKIDENCAILEAAKNAQSKLAFCKVYVSNKYVKKAGVTLADCLAEPEANVALVRESVFAPPVAPLPPPIEVETPGLTVIPATEFGTCSFPKGSRLTNECKAVLDTAVIYSKKASGGYVVIEADSLTGVLKSQATLAYLKHAGVDENNIMLRLTTTRNANVAVSYSEQ